MGRTASHATRVEMPARQLSAMKKRAKAMGLSTAEYLRNLVAEDLEADRLARTRSWEELTRPFAEAFKGMSEAELDAFVDRARRAPS
jgi:hypothetical protein